MNVHVDLLDRDKMTEYNVAADIKVLLSDAAKMDEVKSAIEKMVKIQSSSVEEVGFGIVALKATVLMNDEEGGMDELEKKITDLEAVSQMEVESISRI
jgi:elongation factor 1-beta